MKMASVVVNYRKQIGKNMKPNVQKKKLIKDANAKVLNHFTETLIVRATESISNRETAGWRNKLWFDKIAVMESNLGK